MIGQTIAHYRVTAKIGEGGMGEVYRASDSKLGRDVALKVLPAVFASDAQRMSRFQREAQVLASLNHPNIATIYGLEESGSVRALAMELVEGQTLAERIAQGPIPIEEALPIAQKIAEALEYAHEKGIVHRDLKPANVKVTPQGVVKVLDFGLAKALQSEGAGGDPANSPTISAVATRAGVILGTAAYMSPEQARGKDVDKRADIWAFGCLLYEMLTGKQAFAGDSVTEVLATVLKTEPDWSAVPSSTPANIQMLLRRCLQKDPGRRLRDMGDARIEMEDAVSGAGAEAAAAKTPAAGWREALLWGVAGLLAGALVVGTVLWPRASRKAQAKMRFNVITNFAGVEDFPSLSPDGRSVALVSNRDGRYDIYVALVAGGAMVRITNDANWKTRPRWSPDGSRIVFAKLNDWGLTDIWAIPALGGSARKLLTNATEPAWSPDSSTLVYSDPTSGTLWLCDYSGGKARELTNPEGMFHRQPAFSHDGQKVAFVRRGPGPRGELAVVDVSTKTVRTLTQDSALTNSPVWSPNDEFIYFASSRGGTTNIWRISPSRGEPEQVTAGQGDDAELDLSADGKQLVFSTIRLEQNLAELMLDAPGKSRQITSDAARGENAPAYSPDGKYVAYFSNRKGAENESIWVVGADGSNPTQLAADEFINIFPRWSRDSRTVNYCARKINDIESIEFRRVSIAGGRPETLGEYKHSSTARSGGIRVDVGPDGRLIFVDRELKIWDPRTKLIHGIPNVSGLDPRWSPSGRLIAFRLDSWEEGDKRAGLWVYNFKDPPRQLFRGWAVRHTWAGEDELMIVEGKADLNAPVWRVYTDGRTAAKTPATLQLAYSYLVLTLGTSIELDAHPDRRRIVASQVKSESDIGMIEIIR